MSSSSIVSPIVSIVTPNVAAVALPKFVSNDVILMFCTAIKIGAPSTGILPASFADLRKAGVLTVPQLDAVKNARKQHETLCAANQAATMKEASKLKMSKARRNQYGRITTLSFKEHKVVKVAADYKKFPFYSQE